MSNTAAELQRPSSLAIASGAKSHVDQTENVLPLVVPPRQACAMLSIGLTRCYELISAGELQSFKDGKSRKITVSSIRAYVERQLDARQ
jgi:excisionase family DNA binding protein